MAYSGGFLEDVLSLLDLLRVRAKLDEEKSLQKRTLKVPVYVSDLKSLDMARERCRLVLIFLIKMRIVNDIVYVYEADDFNDNDDEPRFFDVALPPSFESKFKANIRDIKNELELDNVPPASQIATKGKIILKANVLMCGDRRHIFHAGTNGEQNILLEAMNILWPRKRVINGTRKTKGEVLQKSQFAGMLGISTDASAFNRHKENKAQFNNLIRALKRIFREKELPIELNTTGKNIQLIIR